MWNPAAGRRAIESSKPFFAVLDSEGTMVDEDADLDEAYLRAQHASPTGTVIVDKAALSQPEAAPNPPEALRRATDKALKGCGIPVVDFDWENFDPMSNKQLVDLARSRLAGRGREIYEVIRDDAERIGSGTRIHRPQEGGEVGKRGGIAECFNPAWLTGAFLRQNQKMKKVLEGSSRMYDSIGLSLLPHGASFRDPFSTSSDQGPGGATFCKYSTPECRKVCLVNTGQRALESGAFAAGYLFSALIREMPEDFYINLFHRCVEAFMKADRDGFHRFIRLNVLSDLPWERLAPGFIEGVCNYVRQRLMPGQRHTMKEGLALYDYSKIPYRRGIDGFYDLTMSWSGSQGMLQAVSDVLSGDPGSARRVATVFVKREEKMIRSKTTGLSAPYRASPGKPLKSSEQWHSWEFLEEPVWNGDLSDVRPLDPDKVKMVGLIYKPPHYKIEPELRGKKFGLKPVVPVSELDKELPTFIVRVRQPDPNAPPIVVQTQDPDNRVLTIADWKE
jgi:hypothetical protein